MATRSWSASGWAPRPGLTLALGHPGLVKALIVSGAGARGEDIEGQERWARMARMLRERGGAEGVALAAEAMGTRPDLRGALVQIEPPVLVLAGAADRAYPPNTQLELAHSLPGARFQQVAGAGHDLAGRASRGARRRRPVGRQHAGPAWLKPLSRAF